MPAEQDSQTQLRQAKASDNAGAGKTKASLQML